MFEFDGSYHWIGDKMNCKLDKPYPPVEVERENVEYAKILLEDYAGELGEDTAIHEYLFQSLVVEKEKNFFKEIAVVEMHHLFILGELIWKLGYCPAFYTIDSSINCPIPWTSKYLNYSLNLRDILLEDIEREQKTIKRYQKHIEEIADPYIQKILARIIEDEELHIHCLKTLYRELGL